MTKNIMMILLTTMFVCVTQMSAYALAPVPSMESTMIEAGTLTFSSPSDNVFAKPMKKMSPFEILGIGALAAGYIVLEVFLITQGGLLAIMGYTLIAPLILGFAFYWFMSGGTGSQTPDKEPSI